MLKYRIITALCLIPLALAAVYLLSIEGWAVFIALITAVGAHEWSAFAGMKGPWRIAYVVIYLLLLGLIYLNIEHAQWILWGTTGGWLLAIAVVLTYPDSAPAISKPMVSGATGLLLLAGGWTAVVVVRGLPQGSNWIVWLFLLVWGADVGAYFAGRRFGRHKLAPRVSPGKTWEGVIGGALLAGTACVAGLVALNRIGLEWFVLTSVLIVVSVFGDLFESVMKRSSGIKDSGSLLPGHGGVLDRLDSMIAVLPPFCLALIWLQVV